MLHLSCWHCQRTFIRESGVPGAIPRYCAELCAREAKRERRALRTEEKYRQRAEAHHAARTALFASRGVTA